MKGIEAFISQARPHPLVRFRRALQFKVLRLRSKLPRPRRFFKFVRNGMAITMADRWFARRVFVDGKFEQEQVAFFFRAAKERGADVFLDLGANFGYYSLLAAKTGMFAEIHAIEPQPQNYEALQANIAANGFARVITPRNVAASDKRGEVFIDKVASVGAKVRREARADTVAVAAMPMDALFDFSGRNIAVKMDVEYHELAALAGMADLIRRNNVFFQIEIFGESAANIHSMMERGLRLVHRIDGDFYFVSDKGAE